MHIRVPALAALAYSLGALAFGCSGDNFELPSTSTSASTGGDPDVDAGLPDGSTSSGGGDAGAPDSGPPPPPPDETKKAFDPATLHVIDITVDPKYWAQLDDNNSDIRVPCDVKFDSQTLKNSGCRKKGGIGSVQPLSGKPGFSIKFNEYEQGQDLYGMTRLILNNAVQDPTFLNEHLGYEVYRRAGIPAARTAHGIVRLNGVTKGLYIVADAIDKKFLERNFGEGNDQGNLYEAPAWVDFVTDPWGLELKDEVEEMRSRDDILAFSNFVQNAPDAEFAQDVKSMVDLDRFITGYAIDAIFHHWDGYSYVVINNYFMYNDPGIKRFVFMPHGMDQLFDDLNFDIDTWPNGRLSQRVRENVDFDKQFHDSIITILKTVWDVPSLIARIDQVQAVVNTNTNMDPAAVNDINGFNANVDAVRSAVAYRKAILLGEPVNVCGNSALEPTEDCDDGNTVTGDGCSATCFFENCTSASYAGAGYAVCPDAHPFAQSELVCQAYGGALAVPADVAENTWMINTAFAVANQSYWIGVDDQDVEGVYVKPDGTPVTYFAWGVGKPNGAESQNCVALDEASAGLWNDKGCGEPHGAVCKLP